MVDDLTKRRWEKSARPADHDPATALRIALDRVAEFEPDHVVVLIAKDTPDGGSVYEHIQAGKYNDFAQIGMIMQILKANWLDYGCSH